MSIYCMDLFFTSGIFDSVDCHTLFLPATKKVLLQDLSKVWRKMVERGVMVTSCTG